MIKPAGLSVSVGVRKAARKEYEISYNKFKTSTGQTGNPASCAIFLCFEKFDRGSILPGDVFGKGKQTPFMHDLTVPGADARVWEMGGVGETVDQVCR